MAKSNSEMDKSFLTASIPELVSKLSMSEKISLLAGRDWWNTVPVPRLNIPSVKVTDGPNGARGDSFYHMTPATALPNATCIGAAFSTSLVEEAGHLLAAETKARNAVCLLAPTINIQRSPLGGRAFESFSEDPTHSGLVAAAYVNGLQAEGVSATIKHYAGNDQEHERMGGDSVIDPRTLREIYLRPFQIAHALSKPWAYMTGYNKVNGTMASENPFLLQTILRGEWKHDGLIMSDWFGTYSVSESINAGLDLEMPGPAKWHHPDLVSHLVMAHKIDPRTIDKRAEEILSWVQKLTKLNKELVYAPPSGEKTRTADKAKDAKVLRRIGTEGIVLLKNDNVLPIQSGSVAVIGPNAKARVITGGGSAQLRASWSVSPWEGLVENKPSSVTLDYSLGCVGAKFLPIFNEDFTHPTTGEPGFRLSHYAMTPNGEKAAQPAVDEHWDDSNLFMADFSHPDLEHMNYFTEIEATFTAPQDGSYDFGLSLTGSGWLWVDDKLVVDNSKNQKMGSAFFGSGTEEVIGTIKVVKGQKYNIRALHDPRKPQDRAIGDTTPLLILGIRVGAFPSVNHDQAIEGAVTAAKSSDTAIIVAGLNADWESEGYDRPNLSLPLRQNELISRVAAANKNTIVVLQVGSTVSMPWVNEVAGVVYAWYGGNETGNAIADIVYGKVNPSGRLPLSFPKTEKDIAANLNFKSARTQVLYQEGIWVGYKHFNARGIEPLFPFGHGLSYTTFEYTDLSVSKPTGSSADDWKCVIKVTVKNTGKIAGSHSVHVYTAPPAPTATSLAHPEHSLQAFTKVYDLQPGKSQTVTLTLNKYAISHWDELWKTWRAEKGEWGVKVGINAQSMYTTPGAKFTVDRDIEWNGL